MRAIARRLRLSWERVAGIQARAVKRGLARLGLRVVAIDNSSRMLEAARVKLQREQLSNIELRQGEAGALPLADAEVDAAVAHMVLHYLPSPAEAIRELHSELDRESPRAKEQRGAGREPCLSAGLQLASRWRSRSC